MKTDPNHHAFPIEGDDSKYHFLNFGLSKREFFSALAMHAVLSQGYLKAEDVAHYAVWCADELIEELNEEKHAN